MSERTRKILKEFEDTWKEYRYYKELGDKKREELIGEFNNLPLEEQYEVLVEAAKTIDYDRNRLGSPEGIYPFFLEHNKNLKIIDILNYKFPNGIKAIGKTGLDHEVVDGEMPIELYCNLLNLIPGYDAYEKLVTKTNIFKDELGNIDTKKISAYWANPNMDFSYRENHYDKIFKYLDPDRDRERNN